MRIIEDFLCWICRERKVEERKIKKEEGEGGRRREKDAEIVLRIIEDFLCWSCGDRKVEERKIKKEKDKER